MAALIAVRRNVLSDGAPRIGGCMMNPTPPQPELEKLLGRGHRPRKLASAAWFALGCLLMAAMMMIGLMIGLSLPALGLHDMPGKVLLASLFGALVGFALGVPMARCFIHAKRLRAPSALEIISRDHRPPVVYFRPFDADTDASKTIALTSWATDEEQLAKMMNEIGPVIAIGSPGEKLPLLGAARTYVDDLTWREAALGLMGRASVIIMRIGGSAGFWWEFESVIRRAEPQKLVLLVPRNEALYEEFRLASRKLLPMDLPVLTGWNVKKWFRGNLKAVIVFDAKWVPSVIDVQSYRLPFLQRSPAWPLVPVLRVALRPVYENAGVPWSPPRIDGRLVLVLGCVVLALLLQLLR
jgi:hypothetical protein